ncbi:hypothetical protein TNCV_350071 [Trichonephila clavipes]|nr:hypothetical protein TNCV_350071 [Trichonephila clavipes]
MGPRDLVCIPLSPQIALPNDMQVSTSFYADFQPIPENYLFFSERIGGTRLNLGTGAPKEPELNCCVRMLCSYKFSVSVVLVGGLLPPLVSWYQSKLNGLLVVHSCMRFCFNPSMSSEMTDHKEQRVDVKVCFLQRNTSRNCCEAPSRGAPVLHYLRDLFL